MTDFQTNDFESRAIADFAQAAYLNYAMYVILDRALPHISDGLKPVQRRIIYAMSELGLHADNKPKKSARTVGDVLGKFHPHGDSACYEALVLMAQAFSYRYPLIQGQGNFGSLDNPKSFAAMRYTESKLSHYAESLLKELRQNTVDWQANFDGSLQEPTRLPARLPNILLNGATGIAVGMATDIPPHNLNEIVNALCALIDDPNLDVPALMTYIQGPDFPTGGEMITPVADLQTIYQNGIGSVRIRAKYRYEENRIIIDELPYQVSSEKIQLEIAAQMQAKKLPMLEDIRDESDHENPVRIILFGRSTRLDAEAIMQHLFATTDLEKSFRINLNMIGLDQKPRVKNLREILTEWLSFRQNTIQRRITYRLDKLMHQLEIQEGLLIAFLNLDLVLKIIREEDHPKMILMAQLSLSEKQTEAILETKLRHLARLEAQKLSQQTSQLQQEAQTLRELLESPTQRNELLKRELLADQQHYANPRRTCLVKRPQAVALSPLNPPLSEPVTIILSQMGWVRCAKNADFDGQQLSFKTGDAFLAQVSGKSQQHAVFLNTQGRSFSLHAHTLPSVRTQGEPLSGRFKMPEEAKFTHVLLDQTDRYYLLAANNAYGFICRYDDMITRSKTGKALINIGNAELLAPLMVQSDDTRYLLALTQSNRVLIIPPMTMPQLSKGKGHQIINISQQQFANQTDQLKQLCLIEKDAVLILYAGKRKIKVQPQQWQEWVGERGKRGKKLDIAIDRIECKN